MIATRCAGAATEDGRVDEIGIDAAGYISVPSRVDAGLVLRLDPQRSCRVVEIREPMSGANLLVEDAPGRSIGLPDGRAFPVSGWVEVVPSIEPYDGSPTMGTIWDAPAQWSLSDDGVAISTRWTNCNETLTRDFRLARYALHVRYRVENRLAESRPLLWASHPLFSAERLRAISWTGPSQSRRVHVDEQIRSSVLFDGSIGTVGERSSKSFLSGAFVVRLEYEPYTLLFQTDAPWWGIWMNLDVAGVRCVGIEATNVNSDFARDAESHVAPGASLEYSWELTVETRGSNL